MKQVEIKTAEHFNDVSPVWENKIWVNHEDFDNDILKFADLKGTEIGLDCGIGTGSLAKKYDVKEMYGLDISSGMLESVELPKQRLVLSSAENIPFLNNSFDFVTGRNLLKHTDEPKKVLSEMFRVLKPNGKLVIIESTPLDKNHAKIPTAAVRVVEPYHPDFMSKDELLSLIRNAGFKNIDSQVKVFRKKWLGKWCEAKKATKAQKLQIYNLFKNAPEDFKKGQNVELFEDELEIKNDFPWTLVKAFK